MNLTIVGQDVKWQMQNMLFLLGKGPFYANYSNVDFDFQNFIAPNLLYKNELFILIYFLQHQFNQILWVGIDLC